MIEERWREREPGAERARLFNLINVRFLCEANKTITKCVKWSLVPRFNQFCCFAIDSLNFAVSQFKYYCHKTVLWARVNENGRDCGDAISSFNEFNNNHKTQLFESVQLWLTNLLKWNLTVRFFFRFVLLLFIIFQSVDMWLTKHVLGSMHTHVVNRRIYEPSTQPNTVQSHLFCIPNAFFVSVYTILHFVQWFFLANLLAVFCVWDSLLVFCKHEPSWKIKFIHTYAGQREREKKYWFQKQSLWKCMKSRAVHRMSHGRRSLCCSLIMFVHLIRFWFCKCRGNCIGSACYLCPHRNTHRERARHTHTFVI